MSYDLHIYTHDEIGMTSLKDLVHAVAGLRVDGDGTADSFTVLRGARDSYCFDVDGPTRVEPEDVPEEVTGAVLDARFTYSVTVEGTSAQSIPYALRFARKVAAEARGAVLDPQTDQVWSRSRQRTAAKPAREERVDVVDLDWYARADDVDASVADRYLAACRRHLPEALPRRHGSYEPLQGKLAVDGDAGFVSGWKTESSLYFFAATPPCLEGSMSGLHETDTRPVWHMSLSLLAAPLRDPRWRDAAERFFIAWADEVGAFYATAEVSSGRVWTGRSLAYAGGGEISASPNFGGQWTGLMPYPVWWAYYAGPYEHVPADSGVTRSRSTERGHFHSRHEQPAGRDQLTSMQQSGLLKRRVESWTPPGMTSTLLPNPRGMHPAPVTPAPSIPDELTSD